MNSQATWKIIAADLPLGVVSGDAVAQGDGAPRGRECEIADLLVFIKHAPSHYLKQMYLDTVTYNLPAVKMVLDWMGPDRVIYGSDAPPLTSLKPRAIKLIRDLDLPAAERDAIFWGNAASLLKLPLARAPNAA